MNTTQISHLGIVRHMGDIARRLGSPLQLEVLDQGGTDAFLIQRLGSGVAVVTLSFPARYIHTVNETVAISDVDRCVDLLKTYLEEAHTRDYDEGVGRRAAAGPACWNVEYRRMSVQLRTAW